MLEEKGPGKYERPEIATQTAAKRRKAAIEKKKAERGHEVGRTSPEMKGVRAVCRRLVDDPKYLRSLRKRLESGVAGNIEIWLWRYAYGDPAKNDEQAKEEAARFERLRDQVKEFLLRAPERANILDAAVQRAPRLLALPVRHHEVKDGTGPT